MRWRRVLVLALVLGWGAAPVSGTDTVVLEADYWMPYNGDGRTETGYMLDLAKRILEPQGYQVVFHPAPWSRAIADAREGLCAGVVGALRDDVPDFVFPHESLGLGVQEFYVAAGSPWRYTGPASLTSVQLAVIGNYTYFPDLDAYLKTKPKNVSYQIGETPLEKNLRMLLAGRHGAVVDDRNVLTYLVKKLRIEGQVVPAGTGKGASPLYIAFSPAYPQAAEMARRLSDGVAAFRASGQLKKVLAAYNLKDWK